MRLKNNIALFLCAWILGILGAGGALAQKSKDLTLGFYNVENLFDLTDDPYDDDEFTPEGKNKWNEETQKKKIKNLARVIDSLDADVLGLCEVENEGVLRLLSAATRRKYLPIIRDSRYSRGVDVALFYDPARFQPDPRKIKAVPFSLTDGEEKGKASRDFLIVVGTLSGGKDSLAIIVNHWPSRRNTPPNRVAAGITARKVVDSLFKQNKKLNLALMGDFNDNPQDPSVSELVKKDLKNPFQELYTSDTAGSIEYQGKWSLFDQIILSKAANAHFVKKSAQVYKPEWLRYRPRDKPGFYTPNRSYVGSKFVGGYSDHFPVRLNLKFD